MSWYYKIETYMLHIKHSYNENTTICKKIIGKNFKKKMNKNWLSNGKMRHEKLWDKKWSIDVFWKYHETDSQWKNFVCIKDTFQKIFRKMEDSSRYFDWNFGKTSKEHRHKLFLMYVPKKYYNWTHTKITKSTHNKKYYQLYPHKRL